MTSQPGLQDEGVVLERLLNTMNESGPAESSNTEGTKPKHEYRHPTQANTVRFRLQLYVPLIVLSYTDRTCRGSVEMEAAVLERRGNDSVNSL
ncbi:hypothetical protein N7536_010767 [Penicillium majusculum]|nr:hypothetical protein N7536_010767 [Penicillium majusculum]